ncbi:MAG: hypothetical protein K6G42_03730 [Lachnospiraceae bacterium]|nr:hypothetical protein [Lachnospiraceae bacterium]
MEKRVLLCDFTGVYEKEGLCGSGTAIGFSDLAGTDMYIDGEAEKEILKRLSKAGFPGGYALRFLDNGNHHYMTRLLASFADEPFDMITLDNHTDDQPPAFEGLKSCGSWRLDIRKENRYLERSMLIRKPEDMGTEYEVSERPLYISLDKDILSTDVLETNWDQGEMSRKELFEVLDMFFETRRIMAFDVCGEDAPERPWDRNRRFNLELIERYTGTGCS